MLIKSSNIQESSFLQQLITYYESVAGEGQIQRKMASYMSEVYGNIGNSVNLLVNGYVGNLLKFSNRFNNEIGEYDAEYIFNTEAMNSIITSLTTYKTNYKDSLDKLKPLVESAKENGIEFDYVFDANLFEQDLDQVIACPKSIIEKLEVINSDTTFRDNVDQLSSSLINFIEYAKTNINIGEFDVEQLHLDPNYINLINAYNGVVDQLDINAEAIELERTSGNFANYQVFKERQLEADRRFYEMCSAAIMLGVTLCSFGTLGPFLFTLTVASDAICLAYSASEWKEAEGLEQNVARKADTQSAAFNPLRDRLFGNKEAYNNVKNANKVANTVLHFIGGVKGLTHVSTMGSSVSPSKVYGISLKELSKKKAKEFATDVAVETTKTFVGSVMEQNGCSERARVAVTEGAIPLTKEGTSLVKGIKNKIKPKDVKGIDTFSSNMYVSVNKNNSKVSINAGVFIPKNSLLGGNEPTTSSGVHFDVNIPQISGDEIIIPDKIIDPFKDVSPFKKKGFNIK